MQMDITSVCEQEKVNLEQFENKYHEARSFFFTSF